LLNCQTCARLLSIWFYCCRRNTADLGRRHDTSRATQKTRSLDRYNNVQDYMRQHKAIADIATKAAQHGQQCFLFVKHSLFNLFML